MGNGTVCLRDSGAKTGLVLCHGTFDVLHVGHVRHLEAARRMGERLVVSITADAYCTKRRPVFSDEERSAMLLALRLLDEVFVCHGKTAVLAILAYEPAIYCKGVDYKAGVIDEERIACAAVGAEIRYTETAKYSSSRLIA